MNRHLTDDERRDRAGRMRAVVDQINAICDEAGSWPAAEQALMAGVLVRRGQMLLLLAVLEDVDA